MTGIRELAEAWAVWVRETPDDVLAPITHVQLNQYEGGYDVHISAWDVDQAVVDGLASALGCPTNDGWVPSSGKSKRQWSLAVDRRGVDWHVTATQDHDEPVEPGNEGEGLA